ncbi:MAG: hypothetical protein JWN70_3015 [Planctomycetaceae bacterium]|nr:hypothetical protein [Planctomycetaceae bacterium]
MGYYRRGGFLTFNFVIEPEELRQVLSTVGPVLIHNGRVPIAYASTSLTEYIDAYAQYIDAMLETTEVPWRKVANTHIYIGASLDHFTWETCPDASYKVWRTDIPVASLGPQELYYDATRGQLRTDTGSTLSFGAKFVFPKVISLDGDRHEILHETRHFPTYDIYMQIKSLIDKLTIPCKIRSPSRDHRPPIRISKGMHSRLQNHLGLKARHLELL